MEEKCIFDGKIIAWKSLTLDKMTRGFLYGDGIFETMRSHEYKIFRIRDYLERLSNSAKIVNLSIPFDENKICPMIETLLKSLKIPDAYIRLTLWRKKPEAFDPLNEMDSHYLVTVRPLVRISAALYKNGISCIISKKYRKNEHSPVSHIKSLSFLENILCRQQAHLSGVKETLLLNTKGFLAEASVSNVFFVKRGVVFTPSVSCGIVPGIMRKTILEIADTSGIEVKEGKYKPHKIKEADEVFLTNTLIRVLPVTEIDGSKINNGMVGRLTHFFFSPLYKKPPRKKFDKFIS